MSYAAIDSIIQTWAQRHSLSLFTKYKDSEVRSVDIVGKGDQKFQIWVDCPKGDRVSVHVWDYKKRRRDWDVSITELDNILEETITAVRLWM
jgi:hypothetical protein